MNCLCLINITHKHNNIGHFKNKNLKWRRETNCQAGCMNLELSGKATRKSWEMGLETLVITVQPWDSLQMRGTKAAAVPGGAGSPFVVGAKGSDPAGDTGCHKKRCVLFPCYI